MLDKNRKLQLAAAMTIVLSRMANAPNVFSDDDVFRNVRGERMVVRKSMYDWLKKTKRIEGHPEGYRILDRPGILHLVQALRTSPIQAVNGFLHDSHLPADGEKPDEDKAESAGEADSDPEEEIPEEEIPEEEIPEEEIPEEEIPEEKPSGVGEENFPPKEEVDLGDIEAGDIKETFRELDAMIVGASTRNRARYVLSINALALLVGAVREGSFSTRKELFTLRRAQRCEKCVVNEAFAKSWQKVFLDRTEEIGLTERTLIGRESAYRLSDGKTALAIRMVSDAVHLDGIALRKILWPGQYGEEEEAAPDAGETPDPGDAQKPDGGAIEVLSDLVGQLTSVAESMSLVHDSMKSVLSVLSELGEQGREREKRTKEALEPILSGLASIVSKMNSEERDAIVFMKDRLVEIQTRRRSLSNQLESEISREERLIEEMNSVLEKKKQ